MGKVLTYLLVEQVASSTWWHHAYIIYGIFGSSSWFLLQTGDDGSPLTKGSKVRDLLVTAKLDPSLYSGHSFRIGAATSAALAGLEDSTIRNLSRWLSSTFLVYIHTLRTQLEGLS